MKPPWRRERIPDQVRAALRLHPGERVLAVSRSGADGYLIASGQALYRVVLPDVERLRWDLIDRAVWDPPEFEIEVRETDDAALSRRFWPADQTGDLPAVVRDRVTGSILTNSQVAVPGGWARIVARRNADTAAIRWEVGYSPGVDPTDAEVLRQADSELTDLRSRLGI